MALDFDKKKLSSEAEMNKSKGLNSFLWLLVIIIVVLTAFGNIYFVEKFSTAIRVVGVVIGLLIAIGFSAITNQGVKARRFLNDSKTELRRIVWPTRPETTQTTLMVMGVTVIVSLILWGFDSIIVSVITFLTNLRF